MVLVVVVGSTTVVEVALDSGPAELFPSLGSVECATTMALAGAVLGRAIWLRRIEAFFVAVIAASSRAASARSEATLGEDGDAATEVGVVVVAGAEVTVGATAIVIAVIPANPNSVMKVGRSMWNSFE